MMSLSMTTTVPVAPTTYGYGFSSSGLVESCERSTTVVCASSRARSSGRRPASSTTSSWACPVRRSEFRSATVPGKKRAFATV